jgi:toxin ParE1/3/4
MPKSKVEILESAWRELEEIADYHLMMVGPISAKKITDRILDALERLKTFSLSCPYVPDHELKGQDYRILVCDQYLCIYRLVGDVAYVYHIAHGSTEYGNLLK